MYTYCPKTGELLRPLGDFRTIVYPNGSRH